MAKKSSANLISASSSLDPQLTLTIIQLHQVTSCDRSRLLSAEELERVKNFAEKCDDEACLARRGLYFVSSMLCENNEKIDVSDINAASDTISYLTDQLAALGEEQNIVRDLLITHYERVTA